MVVRDLSLALERRQDWSTKPLGKGTGLGLAQVYGSARQSKGSLRIESREGEGTEFRVRIPVRPGGETA